MNRLFTLLFLFLAGALCLEAQEVSGGIRAGLNFSQLKGPSEVDNAGNSLETLTFASGFHIGGMVNVKFNKSLGIRSEFLYSQRGADYAFKGSSYLRLFTENGTPVVTRGERSVVLNISNSYIDIPVTAYARLGSLEFSAGAYGSFLIGSRATGELNYPQGRGQTGQLLQPIVASLNANYLKDDFQQTGLSNPETRTVDNRRVFIPTTLGAYYDTNNSTKALFNRLDAGLIGGIGLFLNQGLYLGFRAQYGLLDVTNTEQDVSLTTLDSTGTPVLRDDFDRNYSLQASIGFSF